MKIKAIVCTLLVVVVLLFTACEKDENNLETVVMTIENNEFEERPSWQTEDNQIDGDNNSDKSQDEAEANVVKNYELLEFAKIKELSGIYYNGEVVRLGDSIEDVSEKLGNQSSPESEVASCIVADLVKEYHYNDLSIQVLEDGTIFDLEIIDKGTNSEIKPRTTGDIKLGDTLDTADAVYGKDINGNIGNEIREYTEDGFHLYFYAKDNVITGISISMEK